ncbi:MAG: hypothetical protein PHF00_02550 [Elusimicrobia bacterium]|nr:hypothetical protein [Elusimicrobiota bacterium]
MSRRLEWLLLAALAAAFALLACRGVAVFPGLHGDEGWIGRYALVVRDHGLYSPHEMNTYTGPIYGWLLGQVFRFASPGALSLRWPGLALNLLAAGLMAWHLRRRFGFPEALVWLGWLCGSALFLLKSRVAWEVYALQPILLSGVIMLSQRLAQADEPPLGAAAGFLALNYLGVLNHFIFLSVPLSLFLAALANDLFLEDRRPAFLRLCGANLLMGAVLCLVKPAVSDAFWTAHRPALLAAAALWPAACAAAWKVSRGGVSGPAVPAARGALLGALGLGLALFFVYHWIALIQIWSGAAVFQRLGAWAPPWWLAAPLYAWAATLLCACLYYALARLSRAEAARLPPGERLLAFWPLAYLASFIVFRNTSSIRYYILPSWLLGCALAYVLPRLAAWRRPAALAPLAAGAVFIYAFAWNETAGPATRRPVRFYVAWHQERSIDFSDNTGLARLARERGICAFVRQDSFTDMPLIFLNSSLPRGSCDAGKSLWTDYCWECARPPYIKWRIVERPSP